MHHWRQLVRQSRRVYEQWNHGFRDSCERSVSGAESGCHKNRLERWVGNWPAHAPLTCSGLGNSLSTVAGRYCAVRDAVPLRRTPESVMDGVRLWLVVTCQIKYFCNILILHVNTSLVTSSVFNVVAPALRCLCFPFRSYKRNLLFLCSPLHALQCTRRPVRQCWMCWVACSLSSNAADKLRPGVVLSCT